MYVSPLEDTWVKSWDEPARGRNFTGAQSHWRSRNLTPWYFTFSWDESHHEQLFPLNSSQTTWWLIRFLGHGTSVWHEFWVTFWFWPSPRFSISYRFLAKVTDLRLRFKVAWHTDRRLAFIFLTSSKAQNQLKRQQITKHYSAAPQPPQVPITRKHKKLKPSFCIFGATASLIARGK